MNPETILMQKIQVEMSKSGARLFRNNVALAWAGRLVKTHLPITVELFPQDVLLRHARPIHAGLCEGSSDLVGWRTVTITEEMLGRDVAIFATIEVKTIKGRVSQEQKNFLAAVKRAGGIAIEARSVEDALRGIDEWY